jgi:hypothetical protein
MFATAAELGNRANQRNRTTTMKRQRLQLLIVTVAAGFLLTGCVYPHNILVREPATMDSPAGELVLRDTVPKPRRVMVVVPPDAPRAWVRGYWIRWNGQLAWIPAHEELGAQSAASNSPPR